VGQERILRRRADKMFGQACMFLIRKRANAHLSRATRHLSRVPTTARCAYYDLLKFERAQQDDPDVLPLVKITFKENGTGNKRNTVQTKDERRGTVFSGFRKEAGYLLRRRVRVLRGEV